MVIFLLMVGIGPGAWALGKQQSDNTKSSSGQNHDRQGTERNLVWLGVPEIRGLGVE
jgi:hypothetical protein